MLRWSLSFLMIVELYTVNLFPLVRQPWYLEIDRRLQEEVQRKPLELWRSGNWFLDRDASGHMTLQMSLYLAS